MGCLTSKREKTGCVAMQMIHDRQLLERYVRDNSIQECFSNWGQYDISLERFARGEFLALHDWPSNQIFFRVSGRVRITFVTESGKEFLISDPQILAARERNSPRARADIVLGDLEFAGVRPSLNVEALTELDCVCISVEKNGDLLRGDVKFLTLVMRNLARKLQSNLRLTYSGRNFSAAAKVASFLISSAAGGTLQPNWRAVAELLHISYRQLMRTLTEFCENGLLKREDQPGAYRILDPRRLQLLGSDIYRP